MKKIDLKKDFKTFYNPPADVVTAVDVPVMNFYMVDGKGDPNTSSESKDAIEALYTVSYALKFMIKKGEMAIDYGVMPLEGLWWADDMSSFTVDDKSFWKFTYMIMQPSFVTKEMAEAAITEAVKKKKLNALSKVRFKSFKEGPAAQIMHIGPFSEEKPSIEKIHEFIRDHGYTFHGLKEKHHEIYLSDIRKAAPAKWKTVIRQPYHDKRDDIGKILLSEV